MDSSGLYGTGCIRNIKTCLTSSQGFVTPCWWQCPQALVTYAACLKTAIFKVQNY